MQRRTALFVPFLLASGLAAKAGARAAYRVPVFQEVATSEYQGNSTAVSRTGRVFTSFPTRNEFPSFHVGELRGGVTVSFLPRDVNESLVNVSNIFIDDADRLWILDSGKLALRDRSLRSHDRARYIMTEARDAFPSAGMVERSGVLYFGDVRHDRVASLHLMTHRVSEMKTPTPIRWADGFSLDSRGNIWFTESESNVPVQRRSAYRLFRIVWA